MKKGIILLALMLTSVICYSQHFKFMGIPIDGSLENFDSILKSKGFVASKRYGKEDTSLYKFYDGIFAGYNVNVVVFATPKSNIVYSVTVIRSVDNEKQANEMCQYIQKTIEEKYEVNKKIVQSENSTRYEVGYGDIVVNYSANENRVYVMYFDIENNKKDQDEKKNDI